MTNHNFIPSNAPLELFEKIFKYYQKWMDQFPRELLWNTVIKFKDDLINLEKSLKHPKFHYILDGDEVVCFYYQRVYSPGEKEELFCIHLSLLDDEEKCLPSLVHQILLECEPYTTSIDIKTTNRFLQDLLISNGFRLGNENPQYTLKTNDLSKEVLQQWMNNKFIDQDYFVELKQSMSDDEIRESAVVFTTLLNDMVRVDNSQTFNHTFEVYKSGINGAKKIGRNHIFQLLRDQHQTLIGHSLLVFEENKPSIAHQYITGCLAPYRGKGLSKYLKANAYQYLLKHYPTVQEIYTDCMGGNAPMIHINKKMGFKETHRYISLIK